MATAVLNPLPETYVELPEQELDERIARAKAALGAKLVILGHHYQRDEVIKFADYRGDSLKLSQQAASRKEAEYIVFCGVHFMAESADILSGEHQIVILPNLAAGCSMADMASGEDVLACWSELARVYNGSGRSGSGAGASPTAPAGKEPFRMRPVSQNSCPVAPKVPCARSRRHS